MGETRIVTVQEDTPQLAALKRAVVYAVLALLTGVSGVLAANHGASLREILIGGFLLAVPVVTRILEGLLDNSRAAEVATSVTVATAAEATKVNKA